MNVKDDLLKWSKQNTVRVFMGSRFYSSNDDCSCQLVGYSLPSFYVLPFGLFDYALMHQELFRVFMQKLSWQACVVLIWPLHLLV